MAFYGFDAMLINLNINDTPVSYTPPRGPAISFTASYNQLESQQTDTIFQYSNLGRLWTFNWLSYVKDVPSSFAASVYLPGGGVEDYTSDGAGGFLTPALTRPTLIKTR